MVDWVTTATTIYCDAVEDEVTLIAEEDGALKCTGYNRYYSPDRETEKLLRRKSRQLSKQLKCEGLECHRMAEYRDKLFSGKT
jgi:hypothetical protein